MDFKVLESFISLYEIRHFSKTAEIRSLSQPALTRQIQGLEKELGYPLFLRSRSGVVPTNQGHKFYEQISGNFFQLQHQLQSLRADSQILSGDYWLGTYAELGHSIVSPLLLEFNQTHPQLRFHLRFLKTRDIFEQLKSGQLDMGIFSPADSSPPLTSYALAKETHVLVSGSALGAKNFPGPENNFYSYSLDDLFIPRMIKLYRKTHGKFKWRMAYTVNSLTAIIHGLKGSDNYSVLPTHRITQELANGELFQVTGPHLSSNLYLTQMEEMRSEYRSKALRKFLLERFKQIEENA